MAALGTATKHNDSIAVIGRDVVSIAAKGTAGIAIIVEATATNTATTMADDVAVVTIAAIDAGSVAATSRADVSATDGGVAITPIGAAVANGALVVVTNNLNITISHGDVSPSLLCGSNRSAAASAAVAISAIAAIAAAVAANEVAAAVAGSAAVATVVTALVVPKATTVGTTALAASPVAKAAVAAVAIDTIAGNNVLSCGRCYG